MDDPIHFYSNLIGIMTVKHNVPFSMYDSDEWRMFMHQLPLKDSGLLRKDMVRKAIVQQRMHVKNEIKNDVWVAKKYYGSITFVCMSVDFCKNHHN